jgi:hypothetical protein
MSAKCRQFPIAGPDTNGEGAGLLEQLPHRLAGGLSCHPAADPFADLAFLDGVIVPHQITQGGHEFSEPPMLYLPSSSRRQTASSMKPSGSSQNVAK